MIIVQVIVIQTTCDTDWTPKEDLGKVWSLTTYHVDDLRESPSAIPLEE